MMTLIYFGLVTPTRFNCVIRHRQPNKFHDVERVWRLLPEFGRSRGNIFRGESWATHKSLIPGFRSELPENISPSVSKGFQIDGTDR